MPLYEFVCPKCQAEKLEILSVSEADRPVICDDCGALMGRMVSHSSFTFAGGSPTGSKPLP